MDFRFNEEEEMFRSSVKEFLDKEISPVADERDKQGPLTKEEEIGFFKGFKRLGIGLDIESLIGMVEDAATLAIFIEELAGAWCSLVYPFGVSMASVPLVTFSSEEMRERLLPKVEKGELLGCFAVTEPNAGSDNRGMQTTAILDGDHYVVNGTKTWITNATVADTCLLIAKDERGEQIFLLVDKETSPFETAELHKLGIRAAPTGELYFDDCHVPKENELFTLIGNAIASGEVEKLLADRSDESEGIDMSGMADMLAKGLSPLNLIFAFLRSGMSVMATGISQAALDASIKYAKERVQFGKPIGRFQLIQEMLYNMTALTESSRLLGYRAFNLTLSGSPEARMASSLAKCYACDAAVKVAYDAIQIHGGNGLSEDLPLERYFRDARMLTIPDGTSEIQKLVVGRELLGKGMSALY